MSKRKDKNKGFAKIDLILNNKVNGEIIKEDPSNKDLLIKENIIAKGKFDDQKNL